VPDGAFDSDGDHRLGDWLTSKLQSGTPDRSTVEVAPACGCGRSYWDPPWSEEISWHRYTCSDGWAGSCLDRVGEVLPTLHSESIEQRCSVGLA
jgi:hypothetical protein